MGKVLIRRAQLEASPPLLPKASFAPLEEGEGKKCKGPPEKVALSFLTPILVECLRMPWSFLRIAAGKHRRMPPDKSPSEGSLIVAALIVLGLVFAGHWIVSYVQNGNPWAITPWYGGAAALIIIIGLFTILRRGGS